MQSLGLDTKLAILLHQVIVFTLHCLQLHPQLHHLFLHCLTLLHHLSTLHLLSHMSSCLIANRTGTVLGCSISLLCRAVMIIGRLGVRGRVRRGLWVIVQVL